MTTSRSSFYLLLFASLLLPWHMVLGQEVSVEGSPAESAFNVGSVATIRATVKGITGEARRYAVFAQIQYAGTTSTTDVQMDRVTEVRQSSAEYEIGWPIPAEAPTGLYTVTIRVEDRKVHRTVATKSLRGFGGFKKQIQISHLATDKASYSPNEPVQCAVTLENLTDSEFKGLRIEFSNADYPWNTPPSGSENPEFPLKVLQSQALLPARGTLAIPMASVGIASLFQEKQTSGEMAPTPGPKAEPYAVAVWNAGRTVLYDLQFTPRVGKNQYRDCTESVGSGMGVKLPAVKKGGGTIATKLPASVLVFLPHEDDLREAIGRIARFLERYRQRHGTGIRAA